MRESFVFHFEYLNDIPEDLQPQYAMFIINYARYGEQPAFEDWRDQKMWNQIRDRIDSDKDKYDRKCRNLRHQSSKETEEQTKDEISAEPAEIVELPQYSNGETKTKNKRFVKPTPEEVKAYCDERKNNIDAQQFVDFYEAKGWKVGREPMKDWKAAVRTWETRHKNSITKPLPDDRLTL